MDYNRMDYRYSLFGCPSGYNGARCENKTGILVTYPLLSQNSYVWVTGVLGFLIFIGLMITGFVCCYKKRKRLGESEMISIIRFRNAFFGDDTEGHTKPLVTTSCENPTFSEQGGEGSVIPRLTYWNTSPRQSTRQVEETNNGETDTNIIVMSPSDDSLDSAFISRRDSLEFQDIAHAGSLAIASNSDDGDSS